LRKLFKRKGQSKINETDKWQDYIPLCGTIATKWDYSNGWLEVKIDEDRKREMKKIVWLLTREKGRKCQNGERKWLSEKGENLLEDSHNKMKWANAKDY